MLSKHQPQDFSNLTTFPPLPDPWESFVPIPPTMLPHPWMIPPLDTSHELPGVPAHAAIIPHASGPASNPELVRSAVAMLLTEELRLGSRVTPFLSEGIYGAIALLELVAKSRP